LSRRAELARDDPEQPVRQVVEVVEPLGSEPPQAASRSAAQAARTARRARAPETNDRIFMVPGQFTRSPARRPPEGVTPTKDPYVLQASDGSGDMSARPFTTIFLNTSPRRWTDLGSRSASAWAMVDFPAAIKPVMMRIRGRGVCMGSRARAIERSIV